MSKAIPNWVLWNKRSVWATKFQENLNELGKRFGSNDEVIAKEMLVLKIFAPTTFCKASKCWRTLGLTMCTMSIESVYRELIKWGSTIEPHVFYKLELIKWNEWTISCSLLEWGSFDLKNYKDCELWKKLNIFQTCKWQRFIIGAPTLLNAST